MKKHLLLATITATLLLTSANAALAKLTVSSTGNSINIDTSGSVGKTTIYVWKNGRYTTRLTKSGTIPLVSASYKFLLIARDSAGTKYKLIKKTFSSDGSSETTVNQRPTGKIIHTTNGTQTTIDMSQSTDPDGKITRYKAYMWKDGKYFKTFSNPTTTLELPPANYRIIGYVMDDKGDKSKYFRHNFKVEEIKPEPIVTPTPVDSNKPNYTIATPGKKDLAPMTAEFKLGGFLEQSKAQYDYMQGYTGDGVNVAVLDTGIDFNHSDLDDNIKGVYSMYGDDGMDYKGHGTHVAGIIGAEKNDIGMHGIAYNADLISIKVLNDYGRGSYNAIGDGIKLAADKEAKVANLSLGGTYYNATYHSAIVGDIRYALKADTSLIFAAGNNGGECKDLGYTSTGRCNYPAALPVFNDYQDLINGKYDGAYIAVGSLKADNTLAYYSNAAGITKDWYMVAHGGDVFDDGITGSMILSTKSSEEASSILDQGSTTTTYKQGTSMAAPIVAGAFAIISEKFPYLVGTEVRDIMFATTTDLGATGVDEIYGHGLLNLQKAMMPVGDMNIPTGGYVTNNSAKYNSDKARISTSSSFGSSLALSSLSATMILDDFNRGYTLDMTSSVNVETMAFSMDQLQQVPLPKGYSVGLEVNGIQNTFSIGRRLLDGTKVHYAQSNTLFGTTGEGALSLTGKTHYISVESPITSNLSAGFIYGRGTASVGGLFTDISTVEGLGLNLDYTSSILSAGISMPTKVISGTISSSIPTARTMSGEIEYDKSTSSLRPDGTQIDMYTNVSLNKNWELAANYTQDMMNIEGMNNHSLNLNYMVRF